MDSLLISSIEIKLELEDEIIRSSEILIIFHFEISGIINNEMHSLKILFSSILLFKFQPEIFGIKVNFLIKNIIITN